MFSLWNALGALKSVTYIQVILLIIIVVVEIKYSHIKWQGQLLESKTELMIFFFFGPFFNFVWQTSSEGGL